MFDSVCPCHVKFCAPWIASGRENVHASSDGRPAQAVKLALLALECATDD